MALDLEQAVDQLSHNLAQLGDKLGGRDAATQFLIRQIDDARQAFSAGNVTLIEANKHIDDAIAGFDAKTHSEAVRAFGADPNLYSNDQLLQSRGPSEDSVTSLLTEIRDAIRSGARPGQQNQPHPQNSPQANQQPSRPSSFLGRLGRKIGQQFGNTRVGRRSRATFGHVKDIFGRPKRVGRGAAGAAGRAGAAGAGGEAGIGGAAGAAGRAGAAGAGGEAGIGGAAGAAEIPVVGWVVAAFAVVTIAALEAGKAIKEMAYAQEQHIRRLSEVSPDQAIAVAGLDINRFGREQEIGEDTGKSSQGLINAIDKFEESTKTYQMLGMNLQSIISAGLLRMVTAATDFFEPALRALNEIVKTLAEENLEPNREKFGEFVKRMADEAAARDRDARARIDALRLRRP